MFFSFISNKINIPVTKQPLTSIMTFETPAFGVTLIETNGWLTFIKISFETALIKWIKIYKCKF